MNDEGDSIPAASIGDTDLEAVARTNPVAAREIARLDELVSRGEESKDDFLRLCELLFSVGSVADSEYLLRRNLDCYGGKALYNRLFGTGKIEEFNNAIDAFGSQFDLELQFVERIAFLDTKFQSLGAPARSDDYQLLSYPFRINFGYIEKDTIEAQIVSLATEYEDFSADECLCMSFRNGVWEIDA